MAPSEPFGADGAAAKLGTCVNPLDNATRHPTPYNWFQLVIPGLVLIPFRIAMTLVVWPILGILGYIAVILSRGSLDDHGLSGCSHAILMVCKVIVRFHLFCLGFFWISTEGEYVSGGIGNVPIVVANHVTFTDYLLLVSQNFAHPVSRVENYGIPIVGRLLKLVQSVDVDRSCAHSRQMVGNEVRRRATDASWRYPVVIFPEGACHSQRGTLEFQQGVFKIGMPVQPIAIEYRSRNHDPGWTNNTTPWTWLIFLAQWYMPVTLHYLPPIHPEGKSACEFAESARSEIATAVKSEVGPYSLADSMYQLLAEAHGRSDHVDFAVGTALMRKQYPLVARGTTVQRLIYAYLRVADTHAAGQFTIGGWAHKLGLQDGPSTALAGQYGVHLDMPLSVRDFVWRSAEILDVHVRKAQEDFGTADLESWAVIKFCEPMWAAAAALELKNPHELGTFMEPPSPDSPRSPRLSPALRGSTTDIEIFSPTFIIVRSVIPEGTS